MNTDGGPNVVNQVLTAATSYGHVARCGCGWRCVQDAKTAADAAGQRHLRDAHDVVARAQGNGAA